MATDKCSQSIQHEQGFSRFWLIVTQLYAGDLECPPHSLRLGSKQPMSRHLRLSEPAPSKTGGSITLHLIKKKPTGTRPVDSLSYEKTQNTLEFFFLFLVIEVVLGIAATTFATIARSIAVIATRLIMQAIRQQQSLFYLHDLYRGSLIFFLHSFKWPLS